MPELPEVETISRDLNTHLSGKTINTVTILDNRNLRGIDSNNFINKLTGTTISKIYRKGKALIVDISDGFSIIFHLRMTGKFIIQDKTLEHEKHSMVIFTTDTENIIFADIRKFATINLIETSKLNENSYLKNIGVDPTFDNFTYSIFKEIVNLSQNKNAKAFLLEQTKIVGIGNIYASEILFNAKISPERIIGSLTNIEINTLHGSIVSILKEAISLRGTTFSDYRDGFNKKGGFQNRLKVYNKYNENCTSCSEKIKKLKQNGRSTFYCNNCQK